VKTFEPETLVNIKRAAKLAEQGMSLRQIGNELGKSRERARQYLFWAKRMNPDGVTARPNTMPTPQG
jgi:orotate phosphoribosyltransferase-like protein